MKGLERKRTPLSIRLFSLCSLDPRSSHKRLNPEDRTQLRQAIPRWENVCRLSWQIQSYFIQKSQSSRKDFDNRGLQMIFSLVCRERSFAEVQARSKCKIPLEKSPVKPLLSNISKYGKIFLFSWIWSRSYETISVSVNDVLNLLWLYQIGFLEVVYMVTDECRS